MSAFNPELIEYLEGKISFEEFERRRKNTEKTTSDGVSKSVHQVFASMMGENEEEEEEEEEEETPEQPTAGDVFALEMVLNRETKKMMKEKRPRSKLPRALRGLMGEANIRFAQGEHQEAILMCMEIIRQEPSGQDHSSCVINITTSFNYLWSSLIDCLSCENEALEQHLEEEISTIHAELSELQNLLDDFVWIHGYENQKHHFTQGGDSVDVIRYIPTEDFALRSAGATVVKTSKSFMSGAKISIWGFCWDYSRSPNVILERDNKPGNCWAMDGTQGFVVIKLSQAISPAAVTLDHSSESFNEGMSSAPKYFSLYGLQDDSDMEKGTFLGTFLFKNDDPSTQTFTLEEENSKKFKYIRVLILDNWGHPNYTCIYGFRVYGV